MSHARGYRPIEGAKRLLLVLAALLLAWQSFAASPTYVSVTVEAEAAAADGTVVACGTGPDRFLAIMFFFRDTNSNPSAVLVGGAAATLVDSIQNGTSGDGVALWRYINPGTGNQNVTWTAADDNHSTAIFLFNDVDQTTPLGTAAKTTGASSTPSATATAVVGDIVIDGVTHPSPEAPGALRAPTGGQTERFDFDESGSVNVGDNGSTLTAAGTSVVMSWNITNGRDWAELAIAVKGITAATRRVFVVD